ncbi:MAG: ribosome silencing factor [Candidatus Aminicenantes bacterium]|jgi:ribosome-associated protein
MTEIFPKKFTKNRLSKGVKISIQVSQEKKGEDIVILDMSEISSFTDTFVIMHGSSSRHNLALNESIEQELKKANITPLSREGLKTAEWILMDYGDFIIHIFSKTAREYYSLEKLWRDAPKITC